MTNAVKKRNPKRSTANRERAYGSKAEWIRSLPCHFDGVVGYTQAAHVTTGGMGRKADASALIPMCGPHVYPIHGGTVYHGGCHQAQHRHGWSDFLRSVGCAGADPIAIAADYEERFQRLAQSETGDR